MGVRLFLFFAVLASLIFAIGALGNNDPAEPLEPAPDSAATIEALLASPHLTHNQIGALLQARAERLAILEAAVLEVHSEAYDGAAAIELQHKIAAVKQTTEIAILEVRLVELNRTGAPPEDITRVETAIASLQLGARKSNPAYKTPAEREGH